MIAADLELPYKKSLTINMDAYFIAVNQYFGCTLRVFQSLLNEVYDWIHIEMQVAINLIPHAQV